MLRASFVAFLMLGAVACSRDSAPATEASAQSPAAASAVPAPAIPARPSSSKVEVADLFYLRSAADPRISPDGTRLVFTVQYSDRVGAPYSRIWTADLPAGPAKPWGESRESRGSRAGEGQEGSAPRWSPDGKRVAFEGRTADGKSGILIANADGGGAQPLVEVVGTNHPLPQVGERFAWSPDGSRIAFVSAG